MPNRTLTIPPVLSSSRCDLFFATASRRALRAFMLLQGFVFTCLVTLLLVAAGAVDPPHEVPFTHAANSIEEPDVRMPAPAARLESDADERHP